MKKITILSILIIIILLGCSNSITSSEIKEHDPVSIKNEYPERFDIYLFIFNTNMEPVKTFTPEDTSGSHTIVWTGCDEAGNSVASGVYYYTLVVGSQSQTKSMLLLN